MINCVWRQLDGGRLQCTNCGWVYKRDAGSDPAKWPHRNCDFQPDLAEAAERLGVPVDGPWMTQQLAQWKAAGYAERDNWPALVFLPCESRREDGVCNACGCENGEKRVKCEWLARMTTANCPKSYFGDGKQALRDELAKAMRSLADG